MCLLSRAGQQALLGSVGLRARRTPRRQAQPAAGRRRDCRQGHGSAGIFRGAARETALGGLLPCPSRGRCRQSPLRTAAAPHSRFSTQPRGRALCRRVQACRALVAAAGRGPAAAMVKEQFRETDVAKKM